MDINQLSKIVKKKISKYEIIKSVDVVDKSFLHKKHKNNDLGKFHLKLKIKSDVLKAKNRIESNKFIYKILDQEMKTFIHSLQILFI
tara:strand:- start:72 stop:332 length:261 start_codon:yes stop_codon:yes gene_type:complete